jgi:hypothetical protein
MGIADVTCLTIYFKNPVLQDHLDPKSRLGSELYGPHGVKKSPWTERPEKRQRCEKAPCVSKIDHTW